MVRQVTGKQVDPIALAAQKIFGEASKLPSKVAEAATEGVKNVAAGFGKFSKVAGNGMAGLFVDRPAANKPRSEVLADSICKLCGENNLSTAGQVLKKLIDNVG